MGSDLVARFIPDQRDEEVVEAYSYQVSKALGYSNDQPIAFDLLSEIFSTSSCVIANIAILTKMGDF